MKRLTIPKVRERLMQMALELADLVEELKRRPPVRKTKTKSNKITPSLCKEVRHFVKCFPSKSNQEVGNFFGINPGRVSEILAGKR